MNPVHILSMLQRLERVFVRETSRVAVESQIMLNQIADRKAENNFHFIMAAIKQESLKKAHKQRQKDSNEEEAKNQRASGGTAPARASNQNAPVNMEQFNITEDYLVTYREFMSALRSGLKTSLYRTLLPRTLSFIDVLESMPMEKTYEVSDVQVDDFYMFRYELNSVFQQHLFQPQKNTELYLLGQNPLSKCQGQPVIKMMNHLQKGIPAADLKVEAKQKDYDQCMQQC